MAARPARAGGRGVSGFEGGTIVGFKAGEERIEHFPPRHDDDIDPFDRPVPPEHFARQSLGPVAVGRRAQLARGRDSEASRRAAVRHYEHRHEASVNPGARRVRAFEIGASPHVFGPGEPLPGHARCFGRLPLVGNGQPFASLCAPPFQHDASVLRSHANEKAVCLRPPALVRLIRALALHVPRCLNWTKLRSYAPLVVTVNLGRLWTVRGSLRVARPAGGGAKNGG